MAYSAIQWGTQNAHCPRSRDDQGHERDDLDGAAFRVYRAARSGASHRESEFSLYCNSEVKMVLNTTSEQDRCLMLVASASKVSMRKPSAKDPGLW